MPHVLVQTDPQPLYFTASTGRDYANVGGAWVPEKTKALRFDRKIDAENFLRGMMPQQAAFAKAEEYGG